MAHRKRTTQGVYHKSSLPPQALGMSALGNEADIPDPRFNVRL